MGVKEKRGGWDHGAEPCRKGWVDHNSKWDRSLLSTSLSPWTPESSLSLFLLVLNPQLPLKHFLSFFPRSHPLPGHHQLVWRLSMLNHESAEDSELQKQPDYALRGPVWCFWKTTGYSVENKPCVMDTLRLKLCLWLSSYRFLYLFCLGNQLLQGHWLHPTWQRRHQSNPVSFSSKHIDW